MYIPNRGLYLLFRSPGKIHGTVSYWPMFYSFVEEELPPIQDRMAHGNDVIAYAPNLRLSSSQHVDWQTSSCFRSIKTVVTEKI